MAVRAVVTDESFDITLSGFDMVWAFRRKVSVPIAEITSANIVPRAGAIRRLSWRLGGTYVPKVVSAGNYALKGEKGRAFASVYRDDEVLEVTTTRSKPKLILLQHPNRHDLAWYLGERIG